MNHRAFTILELLVVVAIVSIVTAVLLPSLGSAKAKAQGTRCLSNARQLQLGWALFASDMDDSLPSNNDTDKAGKDIHHPSWVAGWLRNDNEPGDKSDNSDESLLVGANYIEFGSIGGYVGNASVYRCPGDRSGRVRSISMNAYLNGTGVWQDVNYITYKKLSQIVDPSEIWVFIDEREDSINDGYFAVDMVTKYAIADYPASYHKGAGVVAFGDGHVELHRWIEPTTRPPLIPGEHLPGGFKFTSGLDRDLEWLTAKTTKRTK